MTLSDWDAFGPWRQQIERRLNQIGSAVKGNQDYQADRISDLVEQIAELRAELTAVSEKQDKLIERLKAKFKENGHDTA